METIMSWMSKTSGGEDELAGLLEDMNYDNKLSTVKVSVNKDLHRIEMGSYLLEEAAKGATIEIPLWLAQILSSKRLITYQDSDVELELFKALNREKIQGSLKLSPLRNDFYPQIRALADQYKQNEFSSNSSQGYQKLAIAAHDLITIRIRKLLSLAALSTPPIEIEGQIPKEEQILYKRVRGLVTLWMDTALGELSA